MRFFQDFIGGSQRLSSHSVLHSSQKLPCHSLSKATSYWLYPATTQHSYSASDVADFWTLSGHHFCADVVTTSAILYNRWWCWKLSTIGALRVDWGFLSRQNKWWRISFFLDFFRGEAFQQWHPLVFFTRILESKREKSLLSNNDRIQYEVFLTLKSWVFWGKKKTNALNSQMQLFQNKKNSKNSCRLNCVFFFSAKKNIAFSTWLVEPSALLRRCSRTPWGKSQWWFHPSKALFWRRFFFWPPWSLNNPNIRPFLLDRVTLGWGVLVWLAWCEMEVNLKYYEIFA